MINKIIIFESPPLCGKSTLKREISKVNFKSSFIYSEDLYMKTIVDRTLEKRSLENLQDLEKDLEEFIAKTGAIFFCIDANEDIVYNRYISDKNLFIDDEIIKKKRGLYLALHNKMTEKYPQNFYIFKNSLDTDTNVCLSEMRRILEKL